MAGSHTVTRAVLAVLLAAVMLAGCDATPAPSAAPSMPRAVDPGPPAPTGTVRIAYPEEPGAWLAALTPEPAAVDLASLWGLPLYRLDDSGHPHPGLVRYARVLGGEPWQVELGLRAGRWSDGRPVVAGDVAATVAALRAAGTDLAPLRGVEVVDRSTVRLRFDQPYGRWPYLLAAAGGVLPAHAIEGGGLEAFRSGVPVAGGWYRLAGHEPGLRAVFEAHPAGPLGMPRIARVEILFTPSYETALGLLRDRRVEAVLGHLALNPVQRALRLDAVAAAAPLGGTWVLVRWRDGGALGGAGGQAARAAARAAIVTEQLTEGLLGPFGAVARATIPGFAGPWAQEPPTVPGELPPLSLLIPRWQEATTLTGRALQHALEAAGSRVELVMLEPDRLAAVADQQGDGALVVRRDTPRPPLAARGPPELREVLLAADAALQASGPEVAAAQQALHADGRELPLFRIGVAHAWSQALSGMRPSSWPGLGLWDVGRWSLAEQAGRDRPAA